MTAVLTEPALEAQVSVWSEAPPVLDGCVVLSLGPGEWLVLGGKEDDFPEAAAAVDVSANRVAFELAGPGARGVLEAGCAIDLDAVPVGGCVQTLLARTQVILLRREAEGWWILVRPSFAPYLRAWLLDELENRSGRSV